MKQAVLLLADEWDLGKKASHAEGNICAWIYLFDCLAESETIIKYKEDKKLIGFCGYLLLKQDSFCFFHLLLHRYPQVP